MSTFAAIAVMTSAAVDGALQSRVKVSADAHWLPLKFELNKTGFVDSFHRKRDNQVAKDFHVAMPLK